MYGDVRKQLAAFVEEMHKWELRCLDRERTCPETQTAYEEVVKAGEEEYRAVFEKYCSCRAHPRDGYYSSDPPEYDPENQPIDQIEEVKKGLLEVRTRELRGLQQGYLYRFLWEDGTWKLWEKHHVFEDGSLLTANI